MSSSNTSCTRLIFGNIFVDISMVIYLNILISWIDRSIERVINYTNINHSCPWEERIYKVKVDNISLDKFPFEPLLPSGKYMTRYQYNRRKEKNVNSWQNYLRLFLIIEPNNIKHLSRIKMSFHRICSTNFT